MPWKPPVQPKCARCEKSVYPTEKLDCLDHVWHKACFNCEICKTKLTMSNYRGYDKRPYCKTHYPQQKATFVTDTPESLRLKKQTERQSAVAYHKAFEEEKGKYTAVADDMHTQNAARQQKLMGSGYDQRSDVEKELAASAPAAAAAEEEPEAEHEVEEAAPEESYEEEEAPAEAEAEVEAEAEPEVEEQAYEEEAAPEAEEEAPAGDGVRYVAQYDYEAGDEDEVSFADGDIIVNVTTIDEGWVTGTVERTGESGMLPSNYIEPE